MQLTLLDIEILLHTTLGSLSIADNGMYFKFTHDARKLACDRVLAEMANLKIGINLGGGTDEK